MGLMYVFQNMTQLWLKKLRRNCWNVAQSKIFKFIWNCDGCHFLNVKILPELFHLDIELLQMIFSITSMLQAVPVAWISTVLFAEHSTLLDFANRFLNRIRLYNQQILQNLKQSHQYCKQYRLHWFLLSYSRNSRLSLIFQWVFSLVKDFTTR